MPCSCALSKESISNALHLAADQKLSSYGLHFGLRTVNCKARILAKALLSCTQEASRM
jgi:hypothetical protein